jgi:subtilisin family serine protease
MHQIISMAAVAVTLLFSSAQVSAQDAGPSGIVVPANTGAAGQAYDDASVLVRFKSSASVSDRASARAQINGSLRRAYHLVSGLEHVALHGGLDVKQAIGILRRLPFVAYAEPNYAIHLNQQVPNDEYFPEQWALHNTGQDSMFGVWLGGTPDADVDWPEAWVAAAGNGAVVAVMDTGIDYRHTDLAANVWENTAEANGVAGVDDDGNGYVDDIRGWDFVNEDNNPLDGHGHGTHVAGTIAAVGHNNKGVTGVMWGGQVMALKIFDDTGAGFLADALEGLQYAVAMGVRISNNSWGYSEILPEEVDDHQALYDAIAASAANGHLFVAAAGNDAVDTDTLPHYPSSFDLDNIVAVAATDNYDQLAWFSSYGDVSVDLAAPGDYVFSTYKLFAGSIDDYGWLSGTSMSSPHVAGAAGLLLGLQPTWTYQQVRDQILNNVRTLGALAGTSVTGGMLNVHAALDGVPDDSGGGGGPGPGTPPDTPPLHEVVDQADGTAMVTWDDVNDETGYQLEREKQHKKRGYISTTTMQTGADVTSMVDSTGTGSFRWRIRSYNDAGYSSWSVWKMQDITEASGGGGGGGGNGGGDKPCRGRNCP